jgi:LPS export ABC transporter protein LptC
MRTGLKIVLPILLSMFLFACEDDIATVNIELAEASPIESGKNIEITYSDSALIKVKLFAPQMDRYIIKGKKHVELPKGVKINFYDNAMNLSSRLTSEYAIRYDDEKKMEAKKNVVVTNNKGEVLNTEHLIWDEAKKTIYTQAPVKVTTAKEIIFGDGLESNEDFSKYKITNIRGTVNLNEDE